MGVKSAVLHRQLDKRDLLAVLLIVAGYAFVLLVMPITHEFGYLDDWTYSRTAEKIVNGPGFQPSEYAQMTLVTHAYWGALFATLFGFSFTALTAATMAMSLIAALTFYVLLRWLGFGPKLSGLGVAILTLNPYYIILSYSFMTEITFVALLLLACLCYFKGLETLDNRWLLGGSIFAALLFLTRQFGLAIPLAAVLWLVLARRLNWSRLTAVLLLPLLAMVGYYAWSRGYGPTFSDSVSREALLDMVRRPSVWATRVAHFVYLAAFLPGLTIPLLGKVRHWKWVTALAVAMAGLVYLLWQVKFNQVRAGRSTLDDLSYTWLQPFFGDPTFIYCLGAALTVWLVAGIVERDWQSGLALLRRQRLPVPTDFLYGVAIILFIGTYLVSAGFLDRYWLPLLPFLIAAGLRVVQGATVWRLIPVLGILLLVGAYGATVHLDDYAALSARWQAGRWLVAQGIPYEKIENGVNWDGYYLYDKALAQYESHDILHIGRIFPPHEIIDPEYIISGQAMPGYEVLNSFSYESRLTGFKTHQLLVLKRQ
jgi:hypothetical protein